MYLFPNSTRVSLAVFLSICSVAGCSSFSPRATDYSKDLVFPQETVSFDLMETTIYPDPTQGVRLQYMNRKYPDDIVDVAVYPIGDFTWENGQRLLGQEMDYALHAIDQGVADGQYRLRGEEHRLRHCLAGQESWCDGLRSEFELVRQDGVTLAVFIYFFIEQDKFVRVRTLFNRDLSPGWTGDSAVRELLTEFVVPGESPYMQSKRKAARKQFERIVSRAEKTND